jgi:hypothetical protein
MQTHRPQSQSFEGILQNNTFYLIRGEPVAKFSRRFLHGVPDPVKSWNSANAHDIRRAVTVASVTEASWPVHASAIRLRPGLVYMAGSDNPLQAHPSGSRL